MAMKLTSTAFEHGQPIPKAYTGDGQDKSPPLAWTGPPKGTRSLVLICDDPDAPTDKPWVHWLIWGIQPDIAGLPEAVPRAERVNEPHGGIQGTNSFPRNNLGYGGPAPPPGHGTHHYHFKLYALDTELSLEPGSDKPAVLDAIEGHVLDQTELIGTYER